MKAILFSFTILLFSVKCWAFADTSIANHFKHIIKLVNLDDAKELSKLISYPLKRKNPLPDITDSADFILNYKSIFDSSFKNLLRQYNDSDIFEHENNYGLVGGVFSGEIWIDEDGYILGLASSKTEEKEREIVTEKIKKQINSSVNDWNENVIVGKSKKLLLRVDRTDKGLRYVCWSNGKTIKDTPDIILYNGVEEAQGTQGGWTWTFKNGDWTYVVHDAEICEEFKDCGLFLELSFKDKLKNKIKLTETK